MVCRRVCASALSLALFSSACGEEPSYVCEVVEEETIDGVLSSDRVLVDAMRPLGDVLSELTAGLEGEFRNLQDGHAGEVVTSGRIRFTFEDEALITRRSGNCGGSVETASINGTLTFETTASELLANTGTIEFLYDAGREVETFGLGGDAALTPTFWSVLGESSQDELGYVNTNCGFSPTSECSVTAQAGPAETSDAPGIFGTVTAP